MKRGLLINKIITDIYKLMKNYSNSNELEKSIIKDRSCGLVNILCYNIEDREVEDGG